MSQPNVMTFNDGMDPYRLLKVAFDKYIINTPIESNTIGLQVDYIENENSQEFKSMYIVKRKYDSEESRQQTSNSQKFVKSYLVPQYEKYLKKINANSTFNNNEINNVIQTLRTFYFVYQITLVEIYNDDPKSKEINSQDSNRYYAYTIPIKLLYRRLLPENFKQMNRREYDAFFQRMNPNLAEQAPKEHNPYPLEFIENPEIANAPIDRSSLPDGLCQICLSGDTENGWCRVNCNHGKPGPVRTGHIFHCNCIDEWINTKKNITVFDPSDPYPLEGLWNNTCPWCRTKITQKVRMDDEVVENYLENTPQANLFGKRKKKRNITLKSVMKDIAFLKK
jgi:hypothetical protein